MQKNYISLDIENPNSRGNSICSIGIVVVKDNEIVEEKYSLINPEDRFDLNNSEITGLCYSNVKDSPKLNEYWNEIRDLLRDNIIVGHNIMYDLNVIAKSLERYDIEIPKFKYYCTMRLAKNFIENDSYSLDSMCDLFHIELKEHHNALEDARAAQKIFKYLNEGYDIGEYTEFYYESKFNEKIDSKLETNINSLYGILQGINYDGIIDNEEINKIKLWTEENRIYKQYLLFNRVITELEKILEDNIITEYERIELITVVSSINKSKIYSEATLALQILNGVLDGIICDSKINEKEIENLKTWLNVNDYLKDVYPYDKVLLEVNKVLEDEILTEEESKYLLNIFDNIINPKSNAEEYIDFKDKTFCLTGEFINGSKQEISMRIQELGGIEKTGVSAKLNYLIVGEVGSEAWKFGNIGGKQAKAQELNEKGANIIVVLEEELKI